MPTYFRWTKTDSPNLRLWRENPQKIQYLWNGKESRKAFWVFAEGSSYHASTTVRRGRTLVAFDFTDEGDTIIRHKDNAIYFGYNKTPTMIGEAAHPNGVIWKSNEPDAYGIGCVIREWLSPRLERNGIRQATKKEVAKALGLREREVAWEKWPRLR